MGYGPFVFYSWKIKMGQSNVTCVKLIYVKMLSCLFGSIIFTHVNHMGFSCFLNFFFTVSFKIHEIQATKLHVLGFILSGRILTGWNHFFF